MKRKEFLDIMKVHNVKKKEGTDYTFIFNNCEVLLEPDSEKVFIFGVSEPLLADALTLHNDFTLHTLTTVRGKFVRNFYTKTSQGLNDFFELASEYF